MKEIKIIVEECPPMDLYKFFRRKGLLANEAHSLAKLPCTIEFETFQELEHAINYFDIHCKFRIVVHMDQLVDRTGYSGSHAYTEDFLEEEKKYSDELNTV
jgi:hypothetical protein